MSRLLLSVLFLLVISTAAVSQSVYKTPSGKKYHLSSCRMVENVSEKISVEEAVTLGLDPCKICKPAAAPVRMQASGKEQGQSSTTQCKGLTKAGNRCKHMTRIANGYCYQHQP